MLRSLKLLTHSSFSSPQPRSMTPFSEGEVEEGVLLRLHNGRAKGMQRVPPEFLRYAKLEPKPGKEPCVNMLVPVITSVLSASFRSGFVPQDMNGALIAPASEKGDPLNG